MNKKIVFVFLSLLISSCSSNRNNSSVCSYETSEIGCEVNFINLLSSPAFYNKHLINTVAYIREESGILYLSMGMNDSDVMLYGVISLSFNSELEEKIFPGDMYAVSGVFDHAKMNIDVHYISILPPFEKLQRPSKIDFNKNM